MRRVVALVLLGLVAFSAPANAMSIVSTGTFEDAPAGLLTCVSSPTGSSWCFVAVKNADGVDVHAFGNHAGGPDVRTDSVLPLESLTASHDAYGRPTITFTADVPDVGPVHLVGTTDLPLADLTAGCPAHPIGYEAQSRTRAIAVATVSGSVGTTAVGNWSSCDIYWGSAVSGTWWEVVGFI